MLWQAYIYAITKLKKQQQIESIISRFLSLHIQIGFLWSSKRQCRHRGHLISLQSFAHHSHRKPNQPSRFVYSGVMKAVFGLFFCQNIS